MAKQFQRVIEDFICANCGQEVSGTGFTNHCPKCLFSKHVDEHNPGDRSSNCHGVMKPVGIKLRGGQPDKIAFRCEKCKKEIFNKISANDNSDVITTLPILS